LRRWNMIPTFRNKRYGYKNKGCFDNLSIRHSNANYIPSGLYTDEQP
jgi:hypothetical protein